MVMKAQMELVVMIGLVFVGITIVYFAYNALTYEPGSEPIGIGEEEKVLRKPIEDLMRSAAESALKDMEYQGGYTFYGVTGGEQLQMSFPTENFLGAKVRYWFQCENEYIPDFNEEIMPYFINYIENFIREKMDSVLSLSYRKAYADLDNLEVDVEFTSANMLARINLPVTIDGNPLNPRYVISIPTRYMDIYNFAKDFTHEQTNTRALEVFTITSLQFSDELSTVGLMTTCGESIINTPFEISKGFRDIVLYTLGNINFWTTKDQDPDAKDVEFYIPSVNSKPPDRYSDMKPKFFLPDDFEFKTYEPIILMNTEWLSSMPPAILPFCIQAYDIRYNILYPVIVSVPDDLSGNMFNFAGLVYVDGSYENKEGMKPGSCDSIDVDFNMFTQAEDVCHCTPPHKVVTYVDSVDGPVTGANIMFGPCEFKEIDNGKYEADLACYMEDRVMVYKEGYEFIDKQMTDDEIAEGFHLKRIPKVNLHFYTVELVTEGEYKRQDRDGKIYMVEGTTGSCCSSKCKELDNITKKYCNIKAVDSAIIGGYIRGDVEWPIVPNLDGEKSQACFEGFNHEEFESNINSCMDKWFNKKKCIKKEMGKFENEMGNCLKGSGAIYSSSSVDFVPGGYNYQFDINARDAYGFGAIGGLVADYQISEQDSDLYIYIPMRDPSTQDDYDGMKYNFEPGEKECITQWMRNECGLEPVRDSAFPKTTTA